MSYYVRYTENGVTKDITDFVTSIQYGGEIASAVRKLDISLVSGTHSGTPQLELKKGCLLTLFSDNKELIRTVIFKQDKDDKGSVNITGYTHGIYLAKNKDTVKFEQMTASQIAARICSSFGIPAGIIENTGILLKKLILRDKSLWDMLLIALTETTKQSGVKYRVFFREGRLNICERRKQLTTHVLEEGTNLLSANCSTSIEEMRNQIKVVGRLPGEDNEKELVCVVKNAEFQKLYGILQETYEESGDDITKSKLKQTADNMLKELCKEQTDVNIEVLGIDEIEAGMAVYVKESITGLTGVYYIDQDDHSIEGGKHTMSLKLNRTDDIPQLEHENLG